MFSTDFLAKSVTRALALNLSEIFLVSDSAALPPWVRLVGEGEWVIAVGSCWISVLDWRGRGVQLEEFLLWRLATEGADPTVAAWTQ